MMLAGGLLLFTAPAVRAVAARSLDTENPTAAPSKATTRARVAETKNSTSNKARKSVMSHRSMLAILGLSESKNVTTPAQRQRQLHAHQEQLRAKARAEARSRRARCGKPLL